MRRSARRCWRHWPFPQPPPQRPERIAPESQAQAAERGPGGEAGQVLPDLDSVDVGGCNGRMLLMIGLVISALGMAFGAVPPHGRAGFGRRFLLLRAGETGIECPVCSQRLRAPALLMSQCSSGVPQPQVGGALTRFFKGSI